MKHLLFSSNYARLLNISQLVFTNISIMSLPVSFEFPFCLDNGLTGDTSTRLSAL